MAATPLLLPDLPLPILLFPIGSRNPLKGTVKDGAGNPLVRKISAHLEGRDLNLPELGLQGLKPVRFNNVDQPNTIESKADGTFRYKISDTRPITLVAHGEDGENDVVIKGLKVTT